ncbi:hypothetical protein ABIE27_001345 [Paenibacillus sp. 4624]
MIWHEEEVGKHQPNALFLIYPRVQRMNHRQQTFFEIRIFEWNDRFAHNVLRSNDEDLADLFCSLYVITLSGI